ncbi:unnamed protein product [Fraxinus pennsylvanica]|uniref:Protein kinase domain-containing protein n=1 Tax=Fraxinus pennsylvanica TaxID=56036 RepID=A0AAD2DKZ9_9LAMI|nr:unnamed protein product [Fraxinus pennsylvanica]
MTKSKSFMEKFIKKFQCWTNQGENVEDLERIAAQEQKQFPFETLVAATKKFHHTQKLGEGGFGPVYKGKLDDGREIAVKKLSHSSGQGIKEFQNEAKLLARVQHKNIVNLLGYCVHGSEKLLVYEYVVNESIDKLLFKSDKREILDWKRSNILLDDNWVPKIADFGMARLYPEKNTHVNTRVAGTNGYMAPEYLMHGRLSVKADVFSFGVVVLELISGEKNSRFNRDPESENLLAWAYKLYKKGQSLDIMDPTLVSSAVPDQIIMCIKLGLLCTQSDPQLRPDMRRVVLILSRKPTPNTLEEPTRPGCPGSRYRHHRPTASSSTAGTSGGSNSRSFGSTINTKSATATASSSGLKSPIYDPHGKRPVQY